VVFHSGDQRIEIPSGNLQITDSQIDTEVAFPSGESIWTVYVVAPNEVEQFSFDVGAPIQLAGPEILTGPSAFECWVTGAVGRQVSIQFSNDLVHWLDLTNFMPSMESVPITNLIAEPIGFFRAKVTD
jgi:hypothetical protein